MSLGSHLVENLTARCITFAKWPDGERPHEFSLDKIPVRMNITRKTPDVQGNESW